MEFLPEAAGASGGEAIPERCSSHSCGPSGRGFPESFVHPPLVVGVAHFEHTPTTAEAEAEPVSSGGVQKLDALTPGYVIGQTPATSYQRQQSGILVVSGYRSPRLLPFFEAGLRQAG